MKEYSDQLGEFGARRKRGIHVSHVHDMSMSCDAGACGMPSRRHGMPCGWRERGIAVVGTMVKTDSLRTATCAGVRVAVSSLVTVHWRWAWGCVCPAR